MIRPYDQAKLLFLCFLRSSAALATSESLLSKSFGTHLSSTALPSATSNTPTPTSSSVSASTSDSQSSPILDGHISLRIASRSDVPSIQRCNLATLPENYSPDFYANHMRRWPDLALVAEHFPSSATNSVRDGGNRKRRNMIGSYDAGKEERPGKIVGYVLGKVEECNSSSLAPLSLKGDVKASKENLVYASGHVTSLAILPPYRRRGISKTLMRQLHHHMRTRYNAKDVGLHVRVSNLAARRLYCEGMGYNVFDVIRGYYQDGEDAFFMQKSLIETSYDASNTAEEHEEETPQGWRWVGGAVRSYWGNKVGLGNALDKQSIPTELRLPRDIPLSLSSPRIEEEHLLSRDKIDPPPPTHTTSSFEESQRQIITGSL